MINHITISVGNIDTAFSFYKDILKLKPVMKSSRSAYFYAGKIWIALDQREPYNPSENYAHVCFNVAKNIIINSLKK
jgi:catechol 2,3-dioxygenase-like lactoylglutathione lyase family enzyme